MIINNPVFADKRKGEENVEDRHSARLYTTSAGIVLFITLLLLTGILLPTSKVLGSDPVSGAIWTTDPNGLRVNGNLYTNAKDVYLAGGPHKKGTAGLPDGIYYFQVTDPPGKTLLSTDTLEKRRFNVTNGYIYSIDGGTHQWNNDTTRDLGIVVQLWPFKQTPNKGGVYKVWVTKVEYYSPLGGTFGFISSLSKTDNFKVKVAEVPKYFELWVTEGISKLYYVHFYVDYTVDADGSPSTTNDPLLPWSTGELCWSRTEGIYDVFRYETSFAIGTYIYWKFYITNTFTWASDMHGPELIAQAGMVNKETSPSPLKTFSLTIKPPIEEASYFASYTYYDEFGTSLGGPYIVPLTTRTDDTFSGSAYIAGIIKWQFYIEKPAGTEIWRSETKGPETIPPGTTPRNNPYYLSSISGYKFEDHNGNGKWDDDDHGLGCWTINIFKDSPTGTPIATKHTGDDGYFRFDFLGAGTYYVSEEVKSGWVATTSATFGPIDILPNQAVEITNVNFGNFEKFCIKGHKYDDTYGDGQVEPNTPIAGWNITLYKDSEMVGWTLTDSEGSYSFCGLGPGSYTIVEEDKDGWIHTTSASLGPFQGVSGQDITDVDFYNFKLIKVTGHKYSYPENTGLQGWTITLTALTGPDAGKEWTTTTDQNGYYEFSGLRPGTYRVCETPKFDDGWAPYGPTCYEFTAESSADLTFDFYNYKMLTLTDTSDYRCELSSFDLVFTPLDDGSGLYKLSSTNPGSFYTNVVKYGEAGAPVLIELSLPLDQENAPFDSPNFILHHTYIGYTPVVDVHVYAGRLTSPCGSNFVPDWSMDVTNQYSITTTADGKNVAVSGDMPSTGLIFVTVHIDYQISASLTWDQVLMFSTFKYTFNTEVHFSWIWVHKTIPVGSTK